MAQLKSSDYEIQRHMAKLDQVAVHYEAKWGINALPKMVSPEMSAKWQSQMDKLNAAIVAGDLIAVSALVDGTIKGYLMMDREAEAAGHRQRPPGIWEIVNPETGNRYKICANEIDRKGQADDGAIVYTLMEVVRILEGKQLVARHPAEVKAKGKKAEPFDFSKGDEISI